MGLLCGMCLAQAAACGQRQRASSKPNGAPSASAEIHASASTPARSAAPSSPPNQSRCLSTAPGLNEAQLKAALNAWHAARNGGDTQTYASFYAEHFSALLEEGPSLLLVDRERWLVRKPAFAMPAQAFYGASPIAFGAGGARVMLEHEELFLVSTPNGPKIAWQAPAPPALEPLSARLGLWLADEDGALLSATPDPSWADGPPVRSGPSQATRSVLLNRVPRALRAWLGRPVKVLGATGTVCETRLQRFVLRAKIIPELATAARWEGCADGPPSTPEGVAQDVWRLSAKTGRSLIAEFSAPCKGALLAVDPDLPAPPIAAPRPASAELGSAMLSAFRDLPAYAEIQIRFRAEHPEAEGAWDDHDARHNISSLELPGHAPLFFVSVAAGLGCARFSASLSAVWSGNLKNAGEALMAIDDAPLSPSAVVDLNGIDGTGSAVLLGPDGRFEARSVLRLHSLGGARYERDLLSSVPFFAGPC